MLISRQTAVIGSSSWLRKDAEWSINPGDPSAAQFSILDQLEGMDRPPDNKFFFELYWPELEGTEKGPRQLWKQSSNPVLAVSKADVDDYEAVDVPYTSGWGGLQRSGSSALLDGSSCPRCHRGEWWYSVGTRSFYSSRFMPGPPPEAVSQTELVTRV